MTTALHDICQKHKISVRRLASICGDSAAGVSKSAAHKLIRGTADADFIDRMAPHIALSLLGYLTAKGVPPTEATADVRLAFPELSPVRKQRTATMIVRDEGRLISCYEIHI